MESPPPCELRGRKILLVAHDFPPIRSPQAIRATFLCKGLLAAGARVFVLSRDGVPVRSLPSELSDRTHHIHLTRCSPGIFETLVARIAHRRPLVPAIGRNSTDSPARPVELNWKGRWVGRLRRALGWIHFPDDRSAWVPAARRWLNNEAPRLGIEAAILMHEPTAGVRLWRDVDALGIPWGVDLADPVLAPYTRPHWRKRALRLEGELLRHARAVSVTNAGTAKLLAERHGRHAAEFHVLPQGHALGEPGRGSSSSDLVLVYTGRFYRFRPASALIDAVIRSHGVQLRIAGPELPPEIIEGGRRCPDKIKLLGDLDHEQALRAQLDADVLLSVGNRGTPQMPGKVIEYFGAARPILHLSNDAKDPIPDLLASLRRGLSCPNEVPHIMAVLEGLAALKRTGALDAEFDLRPEVVESYSWTRVGQRFARIVADMLPPRGTD